MDLSLKEMSFYQSSKHMRRHFNFLLKHENIPMVPEILRLIAESKNLEIVTDYLISGAIKVAGLVVIQAETEGRGWDVDEIPAVDFGQLPGRSGRHLDALLDAALGGERDRLLRALRAGGDPNACLRAGESALHWAVRAGHTPCVALLLNFGADPNAQDWFLDTPLHDAARWRLWSVAERLLVGGASLHARNRMGQTPADLMGAHVATLAAAAGLSPPGRLARARRQSADEDRRALVGCDESDSADETYHAEELDDFDDERLVEDVGDVDLNSSGLDLEELNLIEDLPKLCL